MNIPVYGLCYTNTLMLFGKDINDTYRLQSPQIPQTRSCETQPRRRVPPQEQRTRPRRILLDNSRPYSLEGQQNREQLWVDRPLRIAIHYYEFQKKRDVKRQDTHIKAICSEISAQN